MKKQIFAAAALLACCSALANPLSSIKPEKSYIQFSGITIDNNFDIRHANKAKWAPDFKVGAESYGLFTDVSLSILPDDKKGVLADFGFGYKTGIFMPYIATYYDKTPRDGDSSRHEDLGYEIGLSVNLHDRIKPWVQADDIVSLRKARARVGAEIDLNKKIFLNAGYAFKSKEKGEELELGIGYII